MKGGYLIYYPNAMMAEDGKTLTGFFPELFFKLQELFNFTYSLVDVDGKFGIEMVNWYI